ncbi:MAG: cytochrome C, partial [Candidatus Deferrimicrobiota bacterium]
MKRLYLLLFVASLAAGATALYAAEDHRPYRDMKISECTECHRDADVSPNHRAGWNADHRLLAVKADANCAM